MIVIVEEEVGKISFAMNARLITTRVSPLPGDGLNEAFGFAVGLRAVWFSEAMLNAELSAGGGEVLGAVSGAAIGEEALDCDVVEGVEVDGLLEGIEDALDLLVWEEAGEGQTGMVIDGDVKAFDAGTRVANGPIAGGTNAWATEAAQLLDVEVEELAWVSALVTEHRRWRLKSGETVEAVAPQDPRDGGLGDSDHGEDLGVGAALATQGNDVRLQFGFGSARLTMRNRRLVVEL